MTKLLVCAFAFGLLACGGSQASPSDPSPGQNGQPDANANTDTAPSPDSTESPSASTKREPKKNDAGEFKIAEASDASRPTEAKLKATATEAAVRFFVLDKENEPIKGVVISLTSPGGKTFYTNETDEKGFVEILLPIGKTYNLVYLSLGRRDIAAKVAVANKPMLNLKLTLRYKREEFPIGLVLDKVNFPTGKATLTNESHRRLDVVVEFMKYKKSARVEISGHTDNVGNRKANKKLSQARANAVRDYLVSQGIDPARLTAVGYGDEKPIAPNDTPEGRETNRRIEAKEL